MRSYVESRTASESTNTLELFEFRKSRMDLIYIILKRLHVYILVKDSPSFRVFSFKTLPLLDAGFGFLFEHLRSLVFFDGSDRTLKPLACGKCP